MCVQILYYAMCVQILYYAMCNVLFLRFVFHAELWRKCSKQRPLLSIIR